MRNNWQSKSQMQAVLNAFPYEAATFNQSDEAVVQAGLEVVFMHRIAAYRQACPRPGAIVHDASRTVVNRRASRELYCCGKALVANHTLASSPIRRRLK